MKLTSTTLAATLAACTTAGTPSPDGGSEPIADAATAGADAGASVTCSKSLVFNKPNGGATWIVRHWLADGFEELVSAETAIEAAWSPDGQHIAYSAWDPYTGGDERLGVRTVGGDRSFLPPESGVSRSPAWSPDSSTIAYGAHVNSHRDIIVISLDGTGRAEISTGRNSNLQTFSPDGTRLLFLDATYKTLWVANADGTALDQITPDAEAYSGADWTPDGQRIVATRWVDPRSELVSMAPDGTDIQLISTSARIDFAPRVSPDGTQIAFVSRLDNDDGIYVVNTDGTDRRRLLTGRNPLAWSPDSRLVAFNRRLNDGVWFVEAASGLPTIVDLEGGGNIAFEPCP